MQEIIVSKKYQNNQEIDGKVAFSSIGSAFSYITTKAIIYLEDEEYFEKLNLYKPNVTIIGKSNGSSVISYDANHSMVKRLEDGGDGVSVYGTTGSATLTIKPEASNFSMVNVVVKNSYQRKDEKGTQAVAFKTEAENTQCIGCSFISTQDTLYVEGNNNHFINCYICGDVDFIFGSANAIFEKCNIEVLDINGHNAYICAPNTFKQNKFGFFFYKCRVTKKGNNKVYLGRPWYPSGAKYTVFPRAVFLECHFPGEVKMRFIQMHEGDPSVEDVQVLNCFIDSRLIVSDEYEDTKEKYLDYFENNKE